MGLRLRNIKIDRRDDHLKVHVIVIVNNAMDGRDLFLITVIEGGY